MPGAWQSVGNRGDPYRRVVEGTVAGVGCEMGPLSFRGPDWAELKPYG